MYYFLLIFHGFPGSNIFIQFIILKKLSKKA